MSKKKKPKKKQTKNELNGLGLKVKFTLPKKMNEESRQMYEEVQRRVKLINDKIAAYSAPCYLCGGKQYAKGQWVPDDRFPTYKSRFLLYTLCERCFHDPKTEDLVQQKLIRSIVATERVN